MSENKQAHALRMRTWRKEHPDECAAQRYRDALRYIRRYETLHPDNAADLRKCIGGE